MINDKYVALDVDSANILAGVYDHNGKCVIEAQIRLEKKPREILVPDTLGWPSKKLNRGRLGDILFLTFPFIGHCRPDGINGLWSKSSGLYRRVCIRRIRNNRRRPCFRYADRMAERFVEADVCGRAG
jgi:hypothetical protein